MAPISPKVPNPRLSYGSPLAAFFVLRLALFTLLGCSTADAIPDADGDGTADPHDCAPNDPAIHVGASERCNEVDDDCDGEVDEGVEVDTWPDLDGDGHGHGSTARAGCPVNGWSDLDDDCDDKDAAVHPGAEERCNELDDDCDGVKDAANTTWFADADGDGYGDDTTAVATCSPPQGFITQGGDCVDSDDAIHPGATELCNTLDDDCDGVADLGHETTWYSDADGDGYGSPLDTQTTCAAVSGWVLNGDDCRPAEAAVNPGASELCNAADDDCDGAVDEGFDADGDGHSDVVCSYGDDCDDNDPTTYPTAPEACEDGLDQDCDGLDVHCGYGGNYDLAYADVRGSGSTKTYIGGHADVGDVDGDGQDDLVLNAYYDGLVVVKGPVSGTVDLANATWFYGNLSTIFGGRSVGAGDMDGDGLTDVGFGAPYGIADGLYILAGPASANTQAEDATAVLRGLPSGMCGHGADIADVNGDGLEDGLVGCYTDSSFGGSGVTYVFYGPVAGEYEAEDADAILYSTATTESAGRWVRGDGDLNADGMDDVMIAAPRGSGAALSGGIIYVFLGPVSGELDLPSADARLLGSTGGGYLGEYRAMIMGDSDGDGADDALVSAYYAGEAGVFFSPTSGDHELASADIQLSDTAWFGSGLDLDDLDDNGIAEVIIGNAAENAEAGASYFYWDLGPGAYTAADADARFLGEAASAAGITNTFADLTGDGITDVVIGASGLDGSGGFYVQEQTW